MFSYCRKGRRRTARSSFAKGKHDMSLITDMIRRKSVAAMQQETGERSGLRRVLGLWQLTANGPASNQNIAAASKSGRAARIPAPSRRLASSATAASAA